MATLTETPKARKVSSAVRSLRISDPINGVRTLVITRDGDRVFYTLRELAVDFGRGFRLDKCAGGTGSDREAASYDVHLDEALGHSCTCKGWCYQAKCKHVDAAAALVKMGKL
jgi:hypothetical protein